MNEKDQEKTRKLLHDFGTIIQKYNCGIVKDKERNNKKLKEVKFQIVLNGMIKTIRLMQSTLDSSIATMSNFNSEGKDEDLEFNDKLDKIRKEVEKMVEYFIEDLSDLDEYMDVRLQELLLSPDTSYGNKIMKENEEKFNNLKNENEATKF
jgi:hypothetical protein